MKGVLVLGTQSVGHKDPKNRNDFGFQSYQGREPSPVDGHFLVRRSDFKPYFDIVRSMSCQRDNRREG